MVTDRIQYLADKQGITIAKMLKDLDMGQGTFASWKKRGTSPKGDALQKIADYFGVSIDYLLGNTNEKEPPAEAEGMSEKTKRFISLYEDLSPEGQAEIDRLVEFFAKSEGKLK